MSKPKMFEHKIEFNADDTLKNFLNHMAAVKGVDRASYIRNILNREMMRESGEHSLPLIETTLQQVLEIMLDPMFNRMRTMLYKNMLDCRTALFLNYLTIGDLGKRDAKELLKRAQAKANVELLKPLKEVYEEMQLDDE